MLDNGNLLAEVPLLRACELLPAWCVTAGYYWLGVGLRGNRGGGSGHELCAEVGDGVKG
jgi:hypothetical protein